MNEHIKVLKFRKSIKLLSIVKLIAHIIAGLLILILNTNLQQYIFLVVGIDLIFVYSLSLFTEIVNKTVKKYNQTGSSLLSIILGILILVFFNDDFYVVSVMWAVASIVNAIIKINNGINELRKVQVFTVVDILFSIVEIVYSIILLMNPADFTEHIVKHIYLLGIGLLLAALDQLITMFTPAFVKSNYTNALIINEEDKEKKLD